MRQLPIVLVVTALLAGCQANLAAVVKATATKPAPAAKASAAPAALPPAVKLAKPAGAKVLTGHVAMDPLYVVGLKAGTVISNDGASVLAAGQVISNDGASVISNDGASLVSPNGGTLLAKGGGNVVAPASLISQDGGGIISNDGASIISNDGGSVISNDGASAVQRQRHLLDAENPHAMRPAAGLALYVRSLSTHKPIALGQDDKGQPAYAVYTNLKGEYELYLPPELEDNVEVVAFLPGKADPRLHLNQIAVTASQGNPVDEDTSCVIDYVRFGFRQFCKKLITGDQDALVRALHLDELVAGAGYKVALKDLTDRIRAAGLDKIEDPVRRDQMADRVCDIVLGHARLDAAAPTVSAHGPAHPFPAAIEGHSLQVLAAFMAERREELGRRFDTEGERTRLEGLAIVVEANKRDKTSYRFQRPSDYGTFLAKAIVGVPDIDPPTVRETLRTWDKQIGLADREGMHEWVEAAFDGIATQLGYALFLNAPVQEELQAYFNEVQKQEGKQP